MGNICRKCRGQEEPEIINYFEKTPLGDISVEELKIPNDQFLCLICGSIPEILGIHTDNNKIEIKCRECGIQTISIKTFIEKTQRSKFTHCNAKCENCNKKKPTRYCIECSSAKTSSNGNDRKEVNVCDDCWKEEKFDHVKTDEKTKKQKIHKSIPFNKKSSKCHIHGKDYAYYCEDCEENFCEDEKEHHGHKIINLSDLVEEAKKSRQIIIEKNNILSIIAKLNLIINNDKDNLENIARLYNSILEENDRNNPKEFEAILEWERTRNEKKE